MKLNINYDKIVSPIRTMHAVGQPPRLGVSDAHMHYLTEAHIPYSRLHDVGGLFGGSLFVDIPNIFRDFDADENDPASYDFAFTDQLIAQLMKAECEPIFRLGVTIENYHDIKAYRIFPPKDFAKWARICEHVIMHYNEGWADGFEYGITYWEIWNEPDNCGYGADNQMWKGTMQEFFELYEVSSKCLKAHFGDTIKVGGFASCGFYALFEENPPSVLLYYLEFAEKFLDFVAATKSPLDFFSWHSYACVEQTEIMDEYVDKLLRERGLDGIETQLNEWNNASAVELRGTPEAASKAAAMMLAMQNKKTTILCYYDARIGQSMYGGMFNPINYKPFGTYYSFKAFGELYVLGNQVELTGNDGIYAVAATDGYGKNALMLANTGESVEIETELDGFRAVRIDGENGLVDVSINPLGFVLGKHEVLLLTNY